MIPAQIEEERAVDHCRADRAAADLPPAVHQSGLGGGNTITINIFDHGNRRPISTKGYSGAVLVAGTGARETVTLVPSGENALKGSSKSAIAPGSTITRTIKTAEGKAGQAKIGK